MAFHSTIRQAGLIDALADVAVFDHTYYSVDGTRSARLDYIYSTRGGVLSPPTQGSIYDLRREYVSDHACAAATFTATCSVPRPSADPTGDSTNDVPPQVRRALKEIPLGRAAMESIAATAAILVPTAQPGPATRPRKPARAPALGRPARASSGPQARGGACTSKGDKEKHFWGCLAQRQHRSLDCAQRCCAARRLPGLCCTQRCA